MLYTDRIHFHLLIWSHFISKPEVKQDIGICWKQMAK